MADLINMSGMCAGRLKVIGRDGSKGTQATWLCRCECGNMLVRPGNKLRNAGPNSSCGCQQGNPTHRHTVGAKMSPTYRSWAAMIGRCTHPSTPAFEYYKRRRITICDRWRNGENGFSGFACFLEDMGERPSLKHSLDRYPDNNSGYGPGNCRWATKREQSNNRHNNHKFEYNGALLSITEISRLSGVSYELLRERVIRKSWPLSEALTAPKQRGRRTDILGPAYHQL